MNNVSIAYRIYPKVSKVPPVFTNDKYNLSSLCLKSFKDSLGSLKVKIWVLLDNCPKEYEELFRSHFSSEELEFLYLQSVGNKGTFELQMKILLEQDFSQYVYFAEDDYFYLPDQFVSMVKFLSENPDVDFISPYDHLDYYNLDLHKHDNLIRIANGKHWRTANSTCLTFLTKKNILQETKSVFNSYMDGNYDASLWISLTKKKVLNGKAIVQYFFKDKFLYDVVKQAWLKCWKQIIFGRKFSLWVPIPSAATHMDSNYLSPNVDWIHLMNSEKES